MIITKDNLRSINDMYFHDGEIIEINCNYYRRFVDILVHYEDVEKRIVFEDVDYISMSSFEPWGAGNYIYDVVTHNPEEYKKQIQEYKVDDCVFGVVILFNSGDEISILARKIVINTLNRSVGVHN